MTCAYTKSGQFNFPQFLLEVLESLYGVSGARFDDGLVPEYSDGVRPSAEEDSLRPTADVRLYIAFSLAPVLKRNAHEVAQEIAQALSSEERLSATPYRGSIVIRFSNSLLLSKQLFGVFPGIFESTTRATMPRRQATAPQASSEWPDGECAQPCVAVIPPRDRLSPLGMVRFAMCAGMQAVCLALDSGLGRRGVVLRVGVREAVVTGFASLVAFLRDFRPDAGWDERFEPQGRNVCSPDASNPAARVPVGGEQSNFEWVAEDPQRNGSTSNRRVVEELGTVATAQRELSHARRIGCSQGLLSHMVSMERWESLAQARDNWWRSFALWCISPVPGREFVPSACILGGDEDVVAQILAIRQRCAQRGYLDLTDPTDCVRTDFGRHLDSNARQALISALTLPHAIRRAALYGRVEELGVHLLDLLVRGRRLLNSPENLEVREVQGAELSYVFSCIYQSLGDVLTMVEHEAIM